METRASRTLPTLARVYKLTIPQLEWVVKGENGLQRPPRIAKEHLSSKVVTVCDSGRYRELLRCGQLAGTPVVTLTGSPDENDRNALPPSRTYREKMERGLHDKFPEMSDYAINDYFESRVVCQRAGALGT